MTGICHELHDSIGGKTVSLVRCELPASHAEAGSPCKSGEIQWYPINRQFKEEH